MKNINDCLKLIASECGWKYLSFDNGKLIQLINRVGNSIAIYDHYFPLNSDTTARICDDRSLQCKLLSRANIKVDENLEFAFSSVNRIIDDLSPLLEQYGQIVVKSNFRRDKFIQRISNKEELIEFAEKNHKLDKVLVNRFVEYKKFYSIYLVNGIVELVCTYSKPHVVGDGQSAIWELLSKANIYAYDDSIDLNKVLNKGETLEASWQIKAPDSKIGIITDGEIVQQLTNIAIKAGRAVGLKTGTIDIYEDNEQIFIQSIDTSLNADILLKQPEYKLIVKNLYAKALKILL